MGSRLGWFSPKPQADAQNGKDLALSKNQHFCTFSFLKIEPMNISMEISMYPLTEQYEAPILRFIDALKQHPVELHVSAMSTQVFGSHEAVMTALQEASKTIFETQPHAILVTKILSSDLSAQAGQWLDL